MGALRNAVMRLRASLGDGADAIERAGEGYRLGSSVELDTQRFDTAIADAVALRIADRCEARTRVESALKLVRGEPFANVAGEAWARSAVTTCTERIAAAEEMLGDLIVSAGDNDGVRVLLRHVEERPEREVRWVQLMLLLDATGRRTEALRAYRRARAALAEFGLQPGRVLRKLADALVNDDDIIGDLHGAEQRRFVGRDQLLADVTSVLSGSKIVTLVGIGGSGKTRLAQELQLQVDHDPAYNGTTVFVDLAAIDDVRLVDMACTSAAGLGSAHVPTALGSVAPLAALLGDDDYLVILDNVEHVADGVANLVRQLAEHCRHTKVLVTSRDRLGVDGEQVIVVPPLPTPAATATDEVCGRNDAVQLLTNLATGTADPQVAARLVRAVGGLPLGIELIASMSAHVPLADLAASLEQTLPGLVFDRPGYQPRQRLDTVFAHAIGHLTPTDRNVLALTTGFTAPFTLSSAEHLSRSGLCGLSIDAPVVASLIRLAEAGLLHVEPGEPQRYSLTPLQARGRQTTTRSSAAGDDPFVLPRLVHHLRRRTRQASTRSTAVRGAATRRR